MTIYIIERDNPKNKPEPQIFIHGYDAEFKVEAEYKEILEELGIDLDDAKHDMDDLYHCYWGIENHVGTVLIAADWDVDRWEWRITAHEI